MALEFPNARLHLYNQLLETRIGCIKAMFASAYELELIPPGSLDHISQPESCDMCSSIWAAKQIIEKFFEIRKPLMDSMKITDRVWMQLKESLDCYNKTDNRIEHNRRSGDLSQAAECSKMAPIVFDFLLQCLRPYV